MDFASRGSIKGTIAKEAKINCIMILTRFDDLNHELHSNCYFLLSRPIFKIQLRTLKTKIIDLSTGQSTSLDKTIEFDRAHVTIDMCM